MRPFQLMGVLSLAGLCLSAQTVVDLTARGIRLAPTPPWDWNMGSFQMVWRDPAGGWNAHADFRRTGEASAR